MPRNSSGSYTLPAGNPVVTHTTITSTWANSTLSDVGSELTSSLDRSGRGAMLAPLPLANGSSALPALTFSAETASGLFRNASQDIEFSVNGAVVQKWLATGVVAPLGATLTQSQSNTVALVATGNGTAAGATLTGGSSNGSGVTAIGGGTSGPGITATGGSSNGAGGVFAGGAGGGDAIQATGTGTASGITASGGATSGIGVVGTGGAPNGIGVYGNGTGTGAGIRAQAGGSSQTAIVAVGNTDYSTAPTGNSTLDKQQTPSNLIRASCRATYNGSSSDPTIVSSFNISAVTNTGSNSFYVELNFDLGTNAIPIFSDFSGAGGVFSIRTVEVFQTVVGSKTRIAFQTLNTTTGTLANPGTAGFNLIVTDV